jgi:predicted ester cyclase
VAASNASSNPNNLRILGAYSARMAAGDYDAVFDTFAPGFRSHVTSRVTPDAAAGDIRPHERTYWAAARAAFPDMKFSVNLLVESGDLIVSNWTIEGTHTGAPFFCVAPSGQSVTINGTAILRMRDGKVVEHWGGPHCSQGIGVAGARFDGA